MNSGVGPRLNSDPVLLWLWCRLVARGRIGRPAWEPPYAVGAPPSQKKRPKKLTYFKNSNDHLNRCIKKNLKNTTFISDLNRNPQQANRRLSQLDKGTYNLHHIC